MAYINFDPQDYFNTVTYTGTGSSQSISVGFRPDLNWIKDRSIPNSHGLFDSVRNAGGTPYELRSNATDAQSDFTGYYGSIDSTGFTVINGGDVNNSGNTYVSWNWLANGSGASNTDGSITTTVSANTTSGFSIVSYTGTGSNASIGHGLGTIPHFLIFKKTNEAGFDWFCYHRSLGAGKFILLDTTGAEQSSTSIWQNTTPTSSLITLGGDGGVNGSGGTYICYAFAEKKGFSKFGSYVGNGNVDAPFIYTGMKPAFLLIRSISSTNWNMFDNKRSVYNVADETLWSNTTGTEATIGTSYGIDILSNGFKPRTVSSQVNNNNTTHIYMAFAENPLVGTNGIPATAR